MSPSKFTAKKTKKNIGEEKSTFFLYSISKISFPPFGNRLHITGTKINKQILNTNVCCAVQVN
jgi:hypothetical protein